MLAGAALFLSIKTEERKLKDKNGPQNYFRKDNFSNTALVKSFRPKQVGHKRLAKLL